MDFHSCICKYNSLKKNINEQCNRSSWKPLSKGIDEWTNKLYIVRERKLGSENIFMTYFTNYYYYSLLISTITFRLTRYALVLINKRPTNTKNNWSLFHSFVVNSRWNSLIEAILGNICSTELSSLSCFHCSERPDRRTVCPTTGLSYGPKENVDSWYTY